MGTPRTRSRTAATFSPGNYETGYYSGGNWVHLSTTAGSGLANFWEYCSDTIEPPPFEEPHSLLINKVRVEPLRILGESNASWQFRRHNDYNPQNMTSYLYAAEPPATDWAMWKAKALANINPFRPKVDVPLFLFEFKDLPRMLRGLGDVLSGRRKPRDVPGGYLAYQFGWVPLFSDLAALINVGENLEKTKRRLADAENGRRIRRRLGGDTVNSGMDPYVYAFGSNWNLERTSQLETTGWATAKVKLLDPLPPYGLERDWHAMRVTLGLNLSASTIWNAIPWSWLIDYFTNFGDIVEARRGYNSWEFSDLFVMVKTVNEIKVTRPLNKVGSLSFTGGRLTYTRKQRSYYGSDPNLPIAFSPIISARQASILGALVTAAALKRSSR